MDNKKDPCRLPDTVDEAAELLISDLLIQHLQALSNMSENEFNILCDKVAPYLIEEFNIWQGNGALLNSCFTEGNEEDNDPTRVILQRVKEMLKDFHGFLVIT